MNEQDQIRRYYNADRERHQQLKQQLDRIEQQLELIKLLLEQRRESTS